MTKRWSKRKLDSSDDRDLFRDLLVFGYSCKLFRDDEKAMYIERGEHLIFLNNTNIAIDRFDVRAAIYDERKLQEFLEIKQSTVSDDEQQIEEICNLERYLDLNEDTEENGSCDPQFYYNYDTNNPINKEENSPMSINEDCYEKPKDLNLPDNIALPKTMKDHTRIEKTAYFIKKNGIQMEILLKTKQAKNPQFDFLNIGDKLYPYYKYLLESFKNGSYTIDLGDNEATTTSTSLEPLVEQNVLQPSPSPPPPPPPPNHSFPVYGMQTNIPPPLYWTVPPPLPKIDIMADQNNPFAQIMSKLNETMKSAISTTSSVNTVKSTASSEKSLLLISQYSDSDSEDDNDDNNDGINNQIGVLVDAAPPDELKLIIDKMAIYVAKNGLEFENIVRSKGDERFSFLSDSHIFHSYYRNKVDAELRQQSMINQVTENVIIPPAFPPATPTPAPSTNITANRIKETDKNIKTGPISFAIKKINEVAVVVPTLRNNDGGTTYEPSTDPLVDEFIDIIDSVEKNAESNKELQLKRKRRAEAFLNKLKMARTKKTDLPTRNSTDRERSPSKHKSKRHKEKHHKDKHKDKYKDKDRSKKRKHSSKDKRKKSERRDSSSNKCC